MMDEPLGALDAEFREHMSQELRALHDRMSATTVYVTHDQLEAMQMGDKIVVMNQGSVEQFGVPQEIYDWPASLFVADFIGSPPMNFLRFNAKVSAGDVTVTLGGQRFEIPTQLQSAAGDLVFGVRPEHVLLKETGKFRGEVIAIEYLGTTQIITINSPNGVLKARVPSSQRIVGGETVGLAFNPKTITLFDQSTGAALLSESNKGVLGHG